jgi:hypothetical protein
MSDDQSRVRETAIRFRQNLPKYVDVVELGVKSKIPFQVMSLREALIWRTDELLWNAKEALERKDISTAAILARALIENTALISRLVDVFDQRASLSPQAMSEQLIQLLFGTREWEQMPKAVNILTCVEHVDKKVQGIEQVHKSLSEYAHPNWKGVMMLYSQTDREKYITYFGRDLVNKDGHIASISAAIMGSVGLFEHLYNKIADEMPGYVETLEKL